MGRQNSISSASRSDSDPDPESDSELEWPFGRIESLHRCDLREAAYELFFMSCRASPTFTSHARNYSGSGTEALVGGGSSAGGSVCEVGSTSPGRGGGGGTVPKGGANMAVNSRIKKLLGMKMRRVPPMRTMAQVGVSSGSTSPGKVKRPMTSAEIMRLQMRVTEHSENRLRKTLMRILVGKMGKRAETIILPLELLRHLKSLEFSDAHEYHLWQRRQLKILEAGLLHHPSTPLDRLNCGSLQLREVLRLSETKPIDTSKNSEAMKMLCNSVVTLAWRSPDGATSDVCHWADGFPFNIHLYLALLQSIFDRKDETVVLDEVDEMVELMKKTWSSLGINRMIHNVCFTWVLFQQYVATGRCEPDLINATLAMLAEVARDAKMTEREGCYVKVLPATLVSMQGWAEKQLLDYHESFERGTVGNMELVLSVALSTSKIIREDVSSMAGSGLGPAERDNEGLISKIDGYIRSSMKNTFTKVFETGHGNIDSMIVEVDEDPSEILILLARDTEQLALSEKETFSSVLKKWHPVPDAVAVATLHNCFGVVLKQYLAKTTSLSNELVRVLQSAGKLEKVLVQMVMEDSENCDDGGKVIVREMVPYDVDLIITGLLKKWMEERLRIGRECLNRAKETESWIPKSKAEPFAQSAVDIMKLAKVTVDEFFEIPVSARDDMVQDLVVGLDSIFQEYTAFIASCGNKQSYIPALPPLTRCNQDSRFLRLWRKAKPRSGSPTSTRNNSNHPRPSTSRGTQRLYIRLNTLHYLHSHIHSLDKSLSLFSEQQQPPAPSPAPSPWVRSASKNNRRLGPSYHFSAARSSIQSAIQYISEVAAYRLIFLDSSSSFYEGLYIGDVVSSRIRPTLRTLKQNLTVLVTVLTDRAQAGAVREVMKASFEAFLMVLLAGGSERAFGRSDHEMVVEDFRSLKKVFCTCGEGLVAEEVVEREAEVVEGIVALMGLATERVAEEFSIAACESSGMMGALGGGGGGGGSPSPSSSGGGQRVLPMPPTTGRWNRSDPNTVLRVLCHRNDDAANGFLKKMFQLPKRR